MVQVFSPQDRSRIAAAIAAAEAQTSGEILVVAADRSDDYIHVPLHIATFCALCFPFLLPLFMGLFPGFNVPVLWIFMAQLLVFLLVALVLSLPALRMWVTPRAMKHKQAHQKALGQFLALNTHSTQGRTGVLIFVSQAERYTEIMGDRGISAFISPSQWQAIVDDMLPHFRSGDLVAGLEVAIAQVGALLAGHFPSGSENPDELPNHFVVIEA